ncbi:MAG TPA: hypothetical protein VIY28_00125 [Pseudonocardiaceae bacterium]
MTELSCQKFVELVTPTWMQRWTATAKTGSWSTSRNVPAATATSTSSARPFTGLGELPRHTLSAEGFNQLIAAFRNWQRP